MRIELFPFQKKALKDIRIKTSEAAYSYNRTHTPQVISFTAPTGAGKTIILSALFEDIFFGNENYPEQQDAIILWLSDSPQLNEQSKLKIDTKADKIRLQQCVTVSEDSFDCEFFSEGHIYFLNTQKLSKTSNLTKNGDGRTYTIWETIANTIAKKSDHLYLVIDEAHRGMKGKDASKATTIMQKFLKGSEEDSIPAMPVVIGMSATTERFNRLVEGTTSTIQRVIITPEEVRDSGLLKDKIIITYPEGDNNNDIAVLQAAAENWKEKCNHWAAYCQAQQVENVNPVFVIQVLNGNQGRLTDSPLEEIISKIEQATDNKFTNGQIVHTFGQTTSTLSVNGIEVPYVEPSRISDDNTIKVVLFKENLSTGWDCPRAETMMSFKHAADSTYIAQLLGRMVRTPKQMRITEDDTLNDVHLYLPYFNERTVNEVVNALQSEEGSSIPTEVYGESIGSPVLEVLTVNVKKPSKENGPLFNYNTSKQDNKIENKSCATINTSYSSTGGYPNNSIPDGFENTLQETNTQEETIGERTKTYNEPKQAKSEAKSDVANNEDNIDRKAIIKFINESGLLSYTVKKSHNNNYITSLFKLAHLLEKSGLDKDAVTEVKNEISQKICAYVEDLKRDGKYDNLALAIKQFKLNTKVFDAFGRIAEDYITRDLFTTDEDIDKQFRIAESKFNEGIGYYYGNLYYPYADDSVDFKVDFILYVANEECMSELNSYAKSKFHNMDDKYRRRIAKDDAKKIRKEYESIVSDGDDVSPHNFRLPEAIENYRSKEGKEYKDHLFLDENSGTVVMNLNSWEEGVIKEEEKSPDFVCWIRNNPKAVWALCIPYEIDHETKAMYPDFIVIRKDPDLTYVIDILEPHNASLTDNLNKAKGFAKYAQQNPEIGRIQLIREIKEGLYRRFKRLDMSQRDVREKVTTANSNEELNHIFETNGFYM